VTQSDSDSAEGPDTQFDLSSITSGPAASTAPDALTAQEQSKLADPKEVDAAEERKLRLSWIRHKVLQEEGIAAARSEFSERVYIVLVLMLIFVAIFVGLSAQGAWKISDRVLITMFGGMTLNVLGIFGIVAKFLFPKDGNGSPFEAPRRRKEDVLKDIKGATKKAARKVAKKATKRLDKVVKKTKSQNATSVR
jgi:hypothetical protein